MAAEPAKPAPSAGRAPLEAPRAQRRPTGAWSLGREEPLEKGMAARSSRLACRIPWAEEPGGLQSTGHTEPGTTE